MSAQLVAAGRISSRRYVWLALPPGAGDGVTRLGDFRLAACPDCGMLDAHWLGVCLQCGARL